MAKITTNFIYNIALTVSTFIINLVIFPYVSRVLGVDNIGRIGFVNNVISYFSLFAVLGIRSAGVREIAAAGQDRMKRSVVFSAFIIVLLVLTSIVTIIYTSCIFLVPRFSYDKGLLLLGISSLFFTSFLIEWFYQGIENFKYITIRTVLIKIIYAVSVVFIVKAPSDIFKYYLLTVLVVVINATINLCYSRKFCDFIIDWTEIKKLIKPIVSLGAYNIMVSMYTTFNVIYLGFVASETQVGYYYTSTKVYGIIIGVFFAFTSVMLPRMSSLVSANRIEEYKGNIKKSYDMTFAASLPIILYCVIMAPEIIRLFAGTGYEGAILPMRIVMPIILLSGVAQIWVQQILMPYRKDKIVFFCAVCSAVVGVAANLLLVKSWGAIGSAIVLLSSEVAGFVLGLIYVMRNKMIDFPARSFLTCIIGSLPYVFMCYFAKGIFNSPFVSLLISGVLSLIWFFLFFYFINKESYCYTFIVQYVDKVLQYRRTQNNLK